MFTKELAELGFTMEWIAMPDSMKRAGHLVAWRKGKKGKKLLFIGHLDTVFEPYMLTNPFTMLTDSTANGQGVNDMKRGDVLVIAPLKALQNKGLINDVSIKVYFTGDEENAAELREISRGDFIERAKQHDIALVFEGAIGLNTLATARRGASEWRLKVEAKQAHSSGILGAAGYGAVHEAARIINEFREQLSKEPYLTYNPALFIRRSDVQYDIASQKEGTSAKINIIAPKAVVMGDLRFLT